MPDYDDVERISMEMGGCPSIPAAYARKTFFNGEIADVSTAEKVYIPCLVKGDITKLMTVLGGTISVADAEVKVSINGVDVTGGAVTVEYDGSAEGDIDTAEPTALNAVEVGDYIVVETDGGSTTAVGCGFAVEITQYE